MKYDQWPQELQDGMQMNEHFKQKVNVKASGVQIPIEIYEGCKLYFPSVFDQIFLTFYLSLSHIFFKFSVLHSVFTYNSMPFKLNNEVSTQIYQSFCEINC